MSINVNTINLLVNMLVFTPLKDIQAATQEDTHIQQLKAYIIQGWPHKTEDVAHSMRQYWPIRSELAIIDIAMKGKRIIIPFQLQRQILQQLHYNHMGIEKTRNIVHKFIYWLNINADIVNIMKNVLHI